MDNNYQPSLNKGAFYCTRCSVYAPHKHNRINNQNKRTDIGYSPISLSTTEFDIGEGVPPFITSSSTDNVSDKQWELYVSVCTHCLQYTVWENRKIIFPPELNTGIPEPSTDMPEEVKNIYIEAELVYINSARASSALIRLAIETLIPKLKYDIKQSISLYEMIEELVKRNIPPHIQQGLDAIRYYGNKSIHTSEIYKQDDKDQVLFLFKLCNMIVEELITKEKEVEEFYESIPEGFRQSINKRDGKTQLK